MKIAIGIETIQRPSGHNYIFQTLENLERAGVMKSEHYVGAVITDGKGRTRQQNAMVAIREAVVLAKTSGADWVMKLEDDLDFTNNFLENVSDWLEDYGHAHTAMFALGASFEFVSNSRFANGERSIFDPGTSFPRVREYIRRGEHIAPHAARGFWGAQALVWRTPIAASLVDWLGEDPALFDGKTHHRNRGHDLLLQVWGQEVGSKVFACAVPSFVQHLGEHSNLDQPEIGHKQPFFQFPFAGHDYRYQRRAQ